MRRPRDGEVLLDDPTELWLRSTYPSAVSDRGEVGWEAFKLHSRDNGELSGVRSSVCSPEEAEKNRLRRRHAAGRSLSTGGTWGVSVAQLTELELQCFDDSAVPTKQVMDLPAGHAFVDLVELDKQQAYDAAVALAEAANANGQICIVNAAEAELEFSLQETDPQGQIRPISA